MSLYATYSDLLSFGATWSLTSGVADSAFPLTNLNDPRADRVSKLTGTSGTYRGTIASTAIQAVAVMNCNLPGLTLAVTNNNAMASQNLVIPAAPADNIGISGWVDLRLVTTAATQWNVAITGAAANIAVGKILLIANLRSFLIRWHLRMDETAPAILKRTTSGTALGYPRGTRYRALEFALAHESARAAYTTLRRGSVGPSKPVVVIPEETVNDLIYGYFPSPSWSHSRDSPQVTRWTDTVEELNPGVSL